MSVGIQAVIFATLLQWQPAIAAVRQTGAAKFWTAFECAAYAELIDDEAEFVRLLNSGFKSGRVFLESARSQGTRYSDLFAGLPDDVTIRLEGPSVEFWLGRVYEAEHQKAWDNVMRQDEYGAWLPVTEWRHTKPEASRTVARQRLRDLACASIQ